ncbi:hypothetical protein CPCC7001_1859 [Cyanobium sp. PCC 7001]|uniref:hypothetical protein n=1 Tax=Cyanobium sp. PCC 7001 TaxID=180281 RepID=UPI0001805C48|nr:hypothetical protein [Cyanobium sp. PCC 7001]EDY38980.1 hypothetical protein CPCC7001_1859 [Cyanobium sp. PCC 7001]
MSGSLRLRPLLLRLRRQPGALRPQVLAALEAHGRPLRWAITAVERGAGDGCHGATLTVEAVVWGLDPMQEPAGEG